MLPVSINCEIRKLPWHTHPSMNKITGLEKSWKCTKYHHHWIHQSHHYCLHLYSEDSLKYVSKVKH